MCAQLDFVQLILDWGKSFFVF